VVHYRRDATRAAAAAATTAAAAASKRRTIARAATRHHREVAGQLQVGVHVVEGARDGLRRRGERLCPHLDVPTPRADERRRRQRVLHHRNQLVRPLNVLQLATQLKLVGEQDSDLPGCLILQLKQHLLRRRKQAAAATTSALQQVASRERARASVCVCV
jgi:hypothetical protein